MILPVPHWVIYTEHARWINLFLLIGVIAGLTANMIIRRDRTIRRTRRILAWIFGLLVNFVYGYSISIREHRTFNGSIGAGTFLLVGCLAAIIWHPKGDNLPPPHDGSLTSRFMFWLDAKVRAYKSRHSE